MVYILVWLNMKTQINSPDCWLHNLLKQYFTNLEALEEIIINDCDSYIEIILNKQHSWSISKPISISNLINVIEQIIVKEIISIGPIDFYPDQRICLYKEEEITLTQKESDILLYLTKHHSYISKSTLLEDLWGYSSNISTHTLETHIYKLRSKFLNKHDIITSNETGYALNDSYNINN